MSLRDLFIRVKSMRPDQAKNYIQTQPEESFTLLDVRQPGEYEKEHIPGARLIPLTKLSDAYTGLDSGKPTIVYCAIGGRSLVAAKMLRGRGFMEVYNLRGGIKAWNGAKADGPHEFHMEFLGNGDSLEAMIKLAFNMEIGLGKVYLSLREKTNDPDLFDLFSNLGAYEESHKEQLREICHQMGITDEYGIVNEGEDETNLMEGGYRIDEFLAKNAPYLETTTNVLNVAMMVETQSLDLFLRLADKVTDEKAKEFLIKLADEEKRHLTLLGQLLEKRI
jgi:rhodanese-related sulfurtransferase/rubrerythrin